MKPLSLDIHSRLTAVRLPAIPQVLVQLIAQCESENAGMAALAQLLANDVALSAKVLSIAASPAFHRGPHPANLERALTTIGVDMVRTLLITESVYQTFNTLGASPGPDLRFFWRHAIGTAITARAVAQKTGYAQIEEAYLCGLLHDIGRLALVAAAPEEYAVNFLAVENQGLCAVEERTLEITHAEAGAWLLERLNLDSFLADSVRYHHDPLALLATAHPLVRITAIADLITAQTDRSDEAIAKTSKLTGIAEADLRSHYQSLDAQIHKLALSLGIDLGELPAVPAAPAAASAQAGHLNDKVRDLMLVAKATDGLHKHHDVDACFQAIVGAAIILFDFTDAIIFTASPTADVLTPTGLQEGRQRLAGLSLPREGEGIAAAAIKNGGVAFHTPSRRPSIAEEQLLRFLNADSLVAVCLGGEAEGFPMLLGAVTAAGARHLENRMPLLRNFGRQAGDAALGVMRRADVQSAATEELAEEFRLASRRVAHEVSNPLSIIKNYLGVLNRKSDSVQPIGEELAILGEEIDRVTQLINEFATSPVVPPEAASDLDAALDSACRLFLESGSVNRAVEIKYHPGRTAEKAAIDARSLRQILLNLIKNASEAMPQGGQIELRNSGTVYRDGRQFLALSVGDTAQGIPADILGKLFSPVQSTKGGVHRGLGLSIVHELVTKARGQISCRSDKTGTLFEILLPVFDGTGTAPTPVRASS
jgi:putative nucleotidyltransferase with HDIG domain